MMKLFSTPTKPVSGALRTLRSTVMVGTIFLVSVVQAFAQGYGNGPAPLDECPKKDGVVRYALGNTQSNSHGLYFLEYYGDDRFATWEFQAGSYMDFYTNGYVILRGTVTTSKNQGPGGDWKVEMHFKFVKDSIFKIRGMNPPVSTAEWRNFKFITEKSFMYKIGDESQKVIFRRMARTERDGGVGEYPLQVGNQAALIAQGGDDGNYGASTWFDYSIDHGKTWRQGDINVILYEKCRNFKPVKLKGKCAGLKKNYWKLINHNKRAVKFYYKKASGQRVVVWVPGARRGRPGVKVFDTPNSVDKLTLNYAITERLGELTAMASLEPCNPQVVCDDNYKTYKLSSYSGNGHSVWLKNFKGQNRKLHFGDKAYLVYQKDYEGGLLFANIESEFLGERGWKVYAKFCEADGVVAKYEKGGTNGDGKTQKQLAEDWNYLLFKRGYIKNRDGSKVIELCAMDNNYGFQIGYSGNGKNWEFGASTWFHWKYNGEKNQGDFNLNLRDICKKDAKNKCTFTMTMDNGKVGNCTKIILCERNYCGPVWYKIINPSTGRYYSYCTYARGGKAWTCKGFNCLRSGKTYVMYVRTKKNMYEPFRFVKK